MLSNPVYVGKIRHRDKIYVGQHDALIGDETWDMVQRMLAANRLSHATRSKARNPSALAGRLFDPDGNLMRPVHTTKNGRRYCYYVSPALIDSSVEVGATGWRIPAAEIEAALAKVIRSHLRQADVINTLIDGKAGAHVVGSITDRLKSLCDTLRDPQSKQCRQLLMAIARRVDLSETALVAHIDLAPPFECCGSSEDAEPLIIDLSASVHLKRRGSELKLILQGAGGDPCLPDPNLITTILDARRHFAAYTRREGTMSISEIASASGASPGDISRSMQLAFLAPDLIEAILDGRQLPDLTATNLQRLNRLPLLWDDQRRLLA